MLFCLAAASVASCAWADTPSTRLPKALLITGLGTLDPEHPKHILAHEFYNDEIVRALEGTAQVTVTENLGSLNAQALSSYDLILNNSFLLEPSPEQLAALFQFIEAGGRLRRAPRGSRELCEFSSLRAHDRRASCRTLATEVIHRRHVRGWLRH